MGISHHLVVVRTLLHFHTRHACGRKGICHLAHYSFHNLQTVVGRRSTASNPVHMYVETFSQRLYRLLVREYWGIHLDDVVSAETLALYNNVEHVMHSYTDPVVYALVRAAGSRAVVSFIRHDNVQAGCGALAGRKAVPTDGAYSTSYSGHYANRPGRPHPATNLDAVAQRLPDLAEGVSDRIEHDRLIAQALQSITADQRTVLLLVDGQGYSIKEVAAMLHLARETVGRKRTAALRAIQFALAA